MIPVERRQIILEMVAEKGIVSIAELTDRMNVSHMTIRRDLQKLEQQGAVVLVSGGVQSPGRVAHEPSHQVKTALAMTQKAAIGKLAASLVQPGRCIYLDAGTTTELMIDYLTTKQTVFVTNAVAHARKLSQAGYTTFILGGELKATTEAIIGPEAVESLRKYNFTKGFWGANGVHRKNGFTTPDPKEAKVKQTAMEHCVKRYVLSDASKFSQISCVKFADFANACIITTKVSDPVYAECDNIIEVQGGEAK